MTVRAPERTSVSGHVLEVHTEQLGATIAAAGAIGATTVDVDDVADFEETGGEVELWSAATDTSTVYGYTAIDEDLNRLTLASALTTAVAVNDEAHVYPHARERIALVSVDDVEGEEPLHAIVRHALRPLLDVGVRQGPLVDAESVTCELVGDHWYVAEVNAQEAALVPDLTSAAPVSDGDPPASSPPTPPAVHGGVGFLAATWTAITNPDPVTYEVHLSTASGFTPDSTTLAGEVQGTIAFLRTMPDGSALAYGTTYYVRLVAKDVDGPAAPGPEGSGSLVQATGPDLAVGSIIAGSGIIADAAIGDAQIQDLSASKITAGIVSALLVLAGELRTADTGRRAVLNQLGLQLLETDDSVVVNLPTDSSQAAAFLGEIVASGFVATGDAALRGSDNIIDTGGKLGLAGDALADPKTAPTVTAYWDQQTLGTEDENRRGFYYDAAGDTGGATPTFVVAAFFENKIREYRASTGTLLRSKTLNYDWVYGVARAGSSTFTLEYDIGAGNLHLRKYAQSTWAFQSDTNIGLPGSATGGGVGMFYDGTNICVCYRATGGAMAIDRYTTALAYVDTITTSGAGNPSFSTSAQMVGGVKLTEDGSTKYWIGVRNDASLPDKVWAWSTTGTFQSGFDFKPAKAPLCGVTHDGTQFWTLQDTEKITKHSNWRWTSGSDTRWIRYTWYASPSETKPSKAASIVSYKRAQLKVSMPALPSAQARIYGFRGSSDDPAPRSNYDLATTTSGSIVFLSAEPGGAAPPSSNSFSGGTPAEVNFGSGKLDGMGTLLVPKGTTAQRPSGAQAQAYHNTDTGRLEIFNNIWKPAQGAAGGKMSKSASQSIASAGNSFTQATFSNTEFDAGGFVDTANNRLLIPANFAGIYRVFARCGWEAVVGADVALRIRIVKNGTAVAEIAEAAINSSSRQTIMEATYTDALAGGDVITLEVAHNTGVARVLLGTGSTSVPPGGATILGCEYLGSK